MKHNTASFSLEQKTEPFIFDVDSLFYHLDCLTDHRDPRGVRAKSLSERLEMPPWKVGLVLKYIVLW
jgi:hypothetical protein